MLLKFYLNPSCQAGSTATHRSRIHISSVSVFLLPMHLLKRRSCYHKYGSHMPLCHVALGICSLKHCLCWLPRLHYWYSDRLCWSNYSPLSYLASQTGPVQFVWWRSSYLDSFFLFCYSFLLLDASHCVPTDSYQRGLPLHSYPSVLFIETQKTRRKM